MKSPKTLKPGNSGHFPATLLVFGIVGLLAIISAQKTVKSLLALLQEMMRQSVDVTLHGERAQKKIHHIHQILTEGIQDIPEFIADNEKRLDALHHTFRKLKDERKELQQGMLGKTGLDEKEVQMVRMIASLMNNKDIARTLNYEEETIKNKITVIRRKLKLKDRCHLVSYAYQTGLVQSPGQIAPS